MVLYYHFFLIPLTSNAPDQINNLVRTIIFFKNQCKYSDLGSPKELKYFFGSFDNWSFFG